MVVVIPYRPNPAEGLELRYALRSIEKHLKGDHQIILIGEKFPNWLKNVKTVQLWEESLKTPGNILKKMIEGLKYADTYLRTDDDIYFNRDHTEIPFYYDGTLADQIEKKHGTYKRMIENTAYEVTHHVRYFDVHAPMMIEREHLETIRDSFPWGKKNLLVKSLYGFAKRPENCVRMDDDRVKFNQQHKADEILTRIKGQPFFSTGPMGVTDQMISVLETLYPNKSRYEN